MNSHDQMSDLILKIHSADLESKDWDQLLGEIEAFGVGEAFAIMRIDMVSDKLEVISANGFPEEYSKLACSLENPSQEFDIQMIKRMKSKEIVLIEDSICRIQLEKTFLNKNVYQKFGLYPFYIRVIYRDENQIFVFIANHKYKGKALNHHHKSKMSMILDHLEISLRKSLMTRKSFALSETMMDVIHRSPHGVILVDQSAKVFFANRSAQDVLEQRDGFTIRFGKIEAAGCDDTATLRRLIRESLTTSDGRQHSSRTGASLRIRRPSCARDFSVFVAPMVMHDFRLGELPPMAAVFVSDPERPLQCERRQVLQSLFDFTATEAAASLLMLDGLGMSHVAESMNVSLATAKTHQRAIFQKLGVRTQAELVRVMLSSVAFLAVQPSDHAASLSHAPLKVTFDKNDPQPHPIG